MPAPKRALVLNIEIQADTDAALAGALRSFATDLALGDLSGHGVVCASSFGWTYRIQRDPAMTQERYFAELEAWLAERDAATPEPQS
jgi:hypothetical protein